MVREVIVIIMVIIINSMPLLASAKDKVKMEEIATWINLSLISDKLERFEDDKNNVICYVYKGIGHIGSISCIRKEVK